jgi:ABC-type multidrug transport system permease subunit
MVKISKFTFELVLLLFLILLTSVISSFYYGFEAFDFLKGILYFTKPILMILVGYAFCIKINDKNFIFI